MRLILPLALAILVTTLSLTAQPRPLPDAPLTPPPPRSSLPLASTASDTLHEAIWLPMGMGVRGDVVRMELVGHKLYAWHQLAPGGSSTDGEMISVWNGDGWDSVMRIDFGEIGSSMFAEYGGKLYVQGNLSDGMTRLYALDGAELDTISIASDSPMRMLVGKAIGTDFYVGGTFAALGRIPGARNIARWDGEGWHALGEGVDNRDRLVKTDEAQVVSMAEYHGKLFVGGIFSHAGEEHSPYLAIWNGSSWEKPAPGGPAGTVAMICTGDDALYTFSYSADEGIWPFMMWDGASWHPIPPPLLTWIGGMAFHDHHLYVAGVSAGDIAIARYDGSEWEEFRGSGRDTTGERFVHARTLIDYDGELVAGGGFAASRGVTLNNVASVRLLTVGVPGAAAQENIAIAPNPSAGWVRVDGRLRDGGSIAVLDMLGRRVMEAPASRALDLGELPNGAYMLAIPTREGMAIRRIVLER